MTRQEAKKLAEECGFTNSGFFETCEMRFLKEVREMCRDNRCGRYGKSWVCPPASGDLEQMNARISGYTWGILLQSTGNLEDALDAENIIETERFQNECFTRFCSFLRAEGISHFPMGSGGCGKCRSCTYPSQPCRFPEEAVSSMEAYGLLVTDVCKSAGIPYYYGRNTITFSACVLFQ